MRLARRWLAVKSIESLQEQANDGGGLKRTLTAFDLMMLGVGVVVGAGIFVVTGRAAALNAGPAVAISFVVAGVAAALAGLCYSEMAAMMPAAGGTYSYASVTMGRLAAFFIGWDLILEYLLGAAMVSVSWSGYVVAFLRASLDVIVPYEWCQAPFRWDEGADCFVRTGAYLNGPACLFVLMVTLLLVRGMRESSRVNVVVVVAKLVAIFLFVAFGLKAIQPANWTPFIPPNDGRFGHFGYSGIMRGASMVFLAYIGFDAISTAAQEAKEPARDLPRGILGSLAVCVALYVVVAMVLTGVVSYTELAVPHPIAVGIDAIGETWLTTVVELGAIAGLTSGAIVMLMGQPRIFYAMAKDGLFFPFALEVHPTYQTPYRTTLLTGLLCAVASGFAPIDVLSDLVSLGTLLAFFSVSVGVTILRRRRPEVARPFRVAGGDYLIPLSSAAVSFSLICSMPASTLLRVGAWMAAGLVFYVAMHRKALREGSTPGR